MVVPERAPSAGSGHHPTAHNDLFLQEITWHNDAIASERVALADEHDVHQSSCLHHDGHRAYSPQDLFAVDALSDSSQQSYQARLGGVWIGQRSVSPATIPSHTAMDGGPDDYSGDGMEDRNGDSLDAADGLQYGKRAPSSVCRSRMAGVLSLAAVMLLILSMALPRWLVRDRDIVHVGDEERLSAAVTVGLFTVCEDTVSGECHRYINNALSSAARSLLWDVEIEECRQLYQATCVCAVLACVLGAIASFFNFTAPQIHMFKYHVAVFIATIVTVIFTSTSLVCWFAWSGTELRRPRLEHVTAGDQNFGGGFDLGISFYCMFASTILMVVAGKLVLYEMFVAARADKDDVPCTPSDDEQFDAESAAPAPPNDGNTVFINSMASNEQVPTATATATAAAAAAAAPGDMNGASDLSRSPPPEYREVDILTSTTLCATGSGHSVDSSDLSFMGRGSPLMARVPSAGDTSYASSSWMASKSECNTPCHLLRHARARSSAVSASRAGNGGYRDADGTAHTRKGSRRFLSRRRWSTVLGQQRSRSSSDLDVVSNQSTSCHLDDDVTTYSVVPKQRRHSQHDASSSFAIRFGGDGDDDDTPSGSCGAFSDGCRDAACSKYGGAAPYAKGTVGGVNADVASPINLDIGALDFDLSLCMRNAALASAGEFRRSPPPFDKFDDDSGLATPVGEQHDFGFAVAQSQRTESVYDPRVLRPSSPARKDTAILHHGLYEYETDL